jgi:hypothetical protein
MMIGVGVVWQKMCVCAWRIFMETFESLCNDILSAVTVVSSLSTHTHTHLL